MGTVLGALVDIGYGVAYRVLDAQFFGVPQRRRRVFIVGCFGDDGAASAEVLAVGEGSGRDSASSQSQGKNAAGTVTDRAGSDSGITGGGVFGQAGYGTYAPGVKTLNASMVKRPEDTVVVSD